MCVCVCFLGMLRRWDDSQQYLSDHTHLVCEETANYLVVICVDYEIDEVSPVRSMCVHVEGKIQSGRTFKILPPLAETCPHGAGGSPGHRHAVHLGFGSDVER